MILSLLILTSINVSAHLAGGTDIEGGETIIDIGYDPSPIIAETPAFILISVQNSTTVQELNTSSLWVRVDNPNQKTLFAGKLVREPTGAYSFTMNFPEAGEYPIKMRFAGEKGNIEGEAVLHVEKQKGTARKILIGGAILIGILTIGTTYINIRKHIKKPK